MGYFEIGKIVNAHGIKGFVRVISFSDDPERFFKLKTVILSLKNGDKEYEIEKALKHKQFILLKLRGIDDMNTALSLKEAVIVVGENEALPLGEDEYHIKDIYDMEVYEKSGEFLGIISDIIFTGANDVYVVKKDGEKDLLIPAIKQCVMDVDVKNARMVINLMEGLRD